MPACFGQFYNWGTLETSSHKQSDGWDVCWFGATLKKDNLQKALLQKHALIFFTRRRFRLNWLLAMKLSEGIVMIGLRYKYHGANCQDEGQCTHLDDYRP